MQRPCGFGKQEIMHDATIAQHGLSSYAGLDRLEIAQLKARAIFAALFKITLLPERVPEFLQTGSQVRSARAPKSRKARE